MNAIFEKTPNDVIDIILDYDRTIKNRNKIYMNQISKTDYRYELLKNIPIKKTLRWGHVFGFSKRKTEVKFTIGRMIVIELDNDYLVVNTCTNNNYIYKQHTSDYMTEDISHKLRHFEGCH